ncbi:MAG: DUF2085 domain-containing protein [Chloroflexota bacterium]
MSSLDTLLIWLDSGVCSQIASHSFWLDGRQLPLCARDLGLFGAFLLTLPLARGTGKLAWLWGLAPLILDGANSFTFEALHWSLYQPSNTIRVTTGALAGACLALVLAPRVTSPRPPDCTPCLAAAERPAVSRTRPLVGQQPVTGVLIGLAAAVLAVASPAAMLALLGTAGVASVVIMANLLAQPTMDHHLAWALAVPELALLAGAKYGLMALLR